MKACFKCGEEKPLAEYYRHAEMADGHLNKCKTCAKADSSKHRAENIERIRAYDRERGARQTPEYQRAYRKLNREKVSAHNAVNRKLTSPNKCEGCGTTGLVHGHHDDYSKPLEVRWLCPPCHSQQHSRRQYVN